MKRIEPTADQAADMAEAVELGAERSRLLVRELLTAAPTDIVAPRYLNWTELAGGALMVTTDKGRFVVHADQVEGFAPALARMVRPELICLAVAGCC